MSSGPSIMSNIALDALFQNIPLIVKKSSFSPVCYLLFNRALRNDLECVRGMVIGRPLVLREVLTGRLPLPYAVL